MLPLIDNPTAEWNEAVVTTVGRGTHSVSTNLWRYIRYFDGSEELYDLRDDPGERLDVHERETEMTELLSLKLKRFMLGVVEREPIEALSPEDIEKLKSLGYLN